MSLSIESIGFAYRGRGDVFDGLSALGLERGTVTAVVGPNGVGKSTLFRLVAGLLRPRAGTMRLDGTDLAGMTSRQRHDAIFFLSQHVAMRAALCVFDYVLLARKAHGGRATREDLRAVEEALGTLHIDHLSEVPVSDLSGGQQQLVSVAQALVRAPSVLLLDEPTSALDLRRQLQVTNVIRETTRRRGQVTLVALHDLALASRCADRFLLIDRKTVVADGRPRDVLSHPAASDVYGVDITLEQGATGNLLVDTMLRTGTERPTA
ncbi:ABC transporter ATP-binding protein [Bosea sp. BIWAKO-01]|uniref:ABC transporter ATP-binding protein n=1 Tax=Bosea sp. BIWAKO-01 TaxID=506668 RepID=UPI000852BEA6|nr:ABC transporter ATP-binding protein [Bosea sp. BIWAKO-01]GAU80305.1 ferrichrome transport ATP-binding protein FhuC [Bosea sp. BIWAKO-01]